MGAGCSPHCSTPFFFFLKFVLVFILKKCVWGGDTGLCGPLILIRMEKFRGGKGDETNVSSVSAVWRQVSGQGESVLLLAVTLVL